MDDRACARLEDKSNKATSSAASRAQLVPYEGRDEVGNVKDNQIVETTGSLKDEVRASSISSAMFNVQSDSLPDTKDPKEVVSAPAASLTSRNAMEQKGQRETCLNTEERAHKGGDAFLGQLQNWFGATANQHLESSDVLMALNPPFSPPPADNGGSDLAKTSLATRTLQFWDVSLTETENPPFTSSSSLNMTTPETLTASHHSSSQGNGPPTNTSAVIAKTLSLQFHKTRMCPFFERGHCRKGAECTYAHDRGELRSAPNLYKTKLCEEWQRGTCRMEANCRFAHGRQELRFTDQVYKTRICHFWSTGDCSKGRLCRHAHGYHELRLDPNLAITGRALQYQEDDQRYPRMMSARSGLLPLTGSRTFTPGSAIRRDTSPFAPVHWRGEIRNVNEDDDKSMKNGAERKIRRCFTTTGFQQLANSVNSQLDVMDTQQSNTLKGTDSRWSIRRSSSLHNRSSFIDLQLDAFGSNGKRVDSENLFQAQNNTFVSGGNELSPRELEAYNALNRCASNANRALMLMNSASSPALQTLCQSPLSLASQDPSVTSPSKAQPIDQTIVKDKGGINDTRLAEQFQRVAQHAIQQSGCQLGKHPGLTREFSGRQDGLTNASTVRGSSRAKTSPVVTSPFIGGIETDVRNSSVEALSPMRASPRDGKSSSDQSTGCVLATDTVWENDAIKQVDGVINLSQFNLSLSSLKQHFPHLCNHDGSPSAPSRLSSAARQIEGPGASVTSSNKDTGVVSIGGPVPPHSPASEMSPCQSSTSLSSSLSTLPQAHDGGSSVESNALVYDTSGVSSVITTGHNLQDTSPSRTLSSDPFERQSSGELLGTLQHKDEQHGLGSSGPQSCRDAFSAGNGSISILDILRQEVSGNNLSNSICWDFPEQTTTTTTVASVSPRRLGFSAEHSQQQCEDNIYREPVCDGEGRVFNSASRLGSTLDMLNPTTRVRSSTRIGVRWNIDVDTINGLSHTGIQALGGVDSGNHLRGREQEQPAQREESRQRQAPNAQHYLQHPAPTSPLLPGFHLGEGYGAGLKGISKASVEQSSSMRCHIEPLITSLRTAAQPDISMSPPPGLAPKRKNLALPSSLRSFTVPQPPPDASWESFLERLSCETGSRTVHDSRRVQKEFPQCRSFRYPATQQSSAKTASTSTVTSCLMQDLWRSQLSVSDAGEREGKMSPSTNTPYNAASLLPNISAVMSSAQRANGHWQERENHTSTPLRLRRPRRSVSAFFLPRWLSTAHEDKTPPTSDLSTGISRIPLMPNQTDLHSGAHDLRSGGEATGLQPRTCFGDSSTPAWEDDVDLDYPQYAPTGGNYSAVLLTSSPTANNNGSAASQATVDFQSRLPSTAFSTGYQFPSYVESGKANQGVPMKAPTDSSFVRGSSMPCPGFTPSSLLPDFLQRETPALEWNTSNGALMSSLSGADFLSSLHEYTGDARCHSDKGGIWQPQQQPYDAKHLHGFRKTPRSSTLFASPIRDIPRADHTDDCHHYSRRDPIPAEFRTALHGSTSVEIDGIRARRMLSDFSGAPSKGNRSLLEKPKMSATADRESFSRQPTSFLSFLSRGSNKKDDTRDLECGALPDTQSSWCSRMATEFLSDGSENSKRLAEAHSADMQDPHESSCSTSDSAPLPWLLRLKHENVMPSPALLQAKTVSSDSCVQQLSQDALATKTDAGLVLQHATSEKDNEEWNEQSCLAGISLAEFRTSPTATTDQESTTDVNLVKVTSEIKETTSSDKEEDDEEGQARNISIRDGRKEEISECSSETVGTSSNVSTFHKTGKVIGLLQNTSLCEIFKNYLEREDSQKQKNLSTLGRVKEAAFQGAAALSTTIAPPHELQQPPPRKERKASPLKYYISEAKPALQTLCGSLTASNNGVQKHLQTADLSTRTADNPLTISHIDSAVPR